MDFKKLISEMKKGEFEFILTKAKNKLFHSFLPTIQISNSLPHVFLFSSTRSGSTWLFELLLKSEKYRAVFESLPELDDCLKKYNTPRIVLSEDHHFDNVEDVFIGFNEGDKINWKQDHANSRNIHLLTNGTLIKSTRANYCVEFIEKNILPDNSKLIYLIRNPFDVIKSKIIRKNTDDGDLAKKFSYTPDGIYNTDDPFFKTYFSQYESVMKKVKNEIQMEAFVWCLENKWILDSIENKDWHLVVYENLVTDFEKEFKRICDFIGIKYLKKIKRSRRIKSSTAFSGNKREFLKSSNFSEPSSFLNKWVSFYTKEQINDILKILHYFEIDYNDLLSKRAIKVTKYPKAKADAIVEVKKCK